MAFNQFPYSNFHELNLDWILNIIKNLENEWNTYKAINQIVFRGDWDITTQYPPYSVVKNDKNGYFALQAVPKGIPITNTDYWVMVYDYDQLAAELEQRLTALEVQVDKLYMPTISLKKPPSGLAACDPTGIIDCAAAAQAIIDYARQNKMIVLVDGVFKIESTLQLSSGDTLIGIGTNTANYDVTTADDLKPILSGFVCPNKTAINIPNRAFGVALKNFAIVGSASNSNPGIWADRIRDSIFENLRVSWFNTGLKLTVLNAEISDDNVMYNTFTNIRVDRCTAGMTMDGGIYGTYSGNCCHNTFVNLNLDAFDACLVLGDTDNNTFVETYCYNRGGDWSVKFKEKCRSNFFYHFQGRALTQGGKNNWIYGYDRENGQKMPYLTKGSLYVITSDGAFLKQTEQGNAYILHGTTYNFGDIQPGSGTLVINNDTSAGQPLFFVLDADGHFKGQLTIT